MNNASFRPLQLPFSNYYSLFYSNIPSQLLLPAQFLSIIQDVARYFKRKLYFLSRISSMRRFSCTSFPPLLPHPCPSLLSFLPSPSPSFPPQNNFPYLLYLSLFLFFIPPLLLSLHNTFLPPLPLSVMSSSKKFPLSSLLVPPPLLHSPSFLFPPLYFPSFQTSAPSSLPLHLV
jgi:hypothetical protein